MILARRPEPARCIGVRTDARIDLTVREADRERACAQARRSIVALLAAIGVTSSRADAHVVLLEQLDADDGEPARF